jgi:hypothetical protein
MVVTAVKKLRNEVIIDSCVTTVFVGLLVYAAYSLWYIFYGTESGPDVHLYTVLSGSALGWFFVVFIKSILGKSKWFINLIAFIAGNALFQGLIWGINAKINAECFDNDDVVVTTFTVIFVISAFLLSVAFLIKAKKERPAEVALFL